MPATVYHALVRDAVADLLKGASLSCPVHALDDPEDAFLRSQPCVAAAPVGPEQERAEFTTNAQTGKGYPVVVMLMTGGVTGGTSSPGPPGLLEFRRKVDTLFHLKRLAAVAPVAYCEVSDAGPIFDEKQPHFQKLTTALVVTAVGRFPRT